MYILLLRWNVKELSQLVGSHNETTVMPLEQNNSADAYHVARKILSETHPHFKTSLDAAHVIHLDGQNEVVFV